jgi:hypothetical protein
LVIITNRNIVCLSPVLLLLLLLVLDVEELCGEMAVLSVVSAKANNTQQQLRKADGGVVHSDELQDLDNIFLGFGCQPDWFLCAYG